MRKVLAAVLLLSLVVAMPLSAKAAEGKNPYGVSNVDPAGPNEVILTVSKGKKKVTFTTSQLMALKSSTISIYEPFVKRRQSFTVIPLETFFKLVGISGSDKVNTKALNDYVYTNTAKKFIEAKTFVAIKRSGNPIGYDEGGPIRLIFGDNSKWAKYLDAWNWSLISINVR